MSSGKRKREREEPPGDPEPDDELLQKKAYTSPRVQIVPGLWQRIVMGRRSENDAKPWTCSCGYVNHPSRHIFFDIPRFKCGHKGCKELIPDDYEWEFSLADVLANVVCPLGNMKDQELRLSSRITRVLLGAKVEGRGPRISMKAFMQRLKRKMQLKRSVDFEQYEELELKDFWKMLRILEDVGIETMDNTQKVCKISGISDVLLQFEQICKEIAGGHPLWTYMRTGKRFGSLKYNEIYVPPTEAQIIKGKSDGLHAIVLFGGGMRKGRKMFYKFMNTHREDFCKLENANRKDGIKGGFGNVIASGILRRPVKFHRDGKRQRVNVNTHCYEIASQLRKNYILQLL